jgi:hypothetical protein
MKNLKEYDVVVLNKPIKDFAKGFKGTILDGPYLTDDGFVYTVEFMSFDESLGYADVLEQDLDLVWSSK